MKESRLKYFLIPFFAIVMGMSGLTIAYQKAHAFLGMPKVISLGLVVLTTALFLIIFILYLFKFLFHKEMVQKELKHPIKINFFPAISISFLLLSVFYHDIHQGISALFWYLGAPIQLFFTAYIIQYWITKEIKVEASNPAWFIPVVGNVLVPITGVDFGGVWLSRFYFSIGIFFWIVLFTIVFYRIVFHQRLAEKFFPTLFILIAPASISYIAYIKISQKALLYLPKEAPVALTFDWTANILYFLALFFTLLLFFMFSLFKGLKYSITWWAYTFPMASITIASLLHYHLLTSEIKKGLIKEEMVFGILPMSSILYVLALIFLSITTLLVAFVSFKTVFAIKNKTICIAE